MGRLDNYREGGCVMNQRAIDVYETLRFGFCRTGHEGGGPIRSRWIRWRYALGTLGCQIGLHRIGEMQRYSYWEPPEDYYGCVRCGIERTPRWWVLSRFYFQRVHYPIKDYLTGRNV